MIGTDPDFLYWYAYFKHQKSILLPCKEVALPLASQIFNIDLSCKRIKDAFGPNMTYTGVGMALRLASNANEIEAEILLLWNCRILQLTAQDVTNFRAVKLLHDISKPLQDFIQCCELHHFRVAERDPSFTALQTMVKDFFSTESQDRQLCLDFLHRLHNALCIA